MKKLDLNAPVVAGLSAAGFDLGMKACAIEPALATAIRSIGLSTPINKQLATGRTFVTLSETGKIQTVHFGEHVCLTFNERSELFCIQLSGCYRGLYLTRFGIGTPIQEINASHPLEFDEGDEVNYPVGQQASGVSFGGTCCSLEVDPTQRVSWMTVHDWSRK